MAGEKAEIIEKEPVKITKQNLLIVEGIDEEKVITALLNYMAISDIQVLGKGGKSQFKVNLGAYALTSGFSKVISLGVIRDADGDAAAAFASVCGALRDLQFAVPGRPLSVAGSDPSVAVMIMPGSKVAGQMLEDLCLEAVKKDPAMPCLADYFHCLEKTDLPPPKNMAKARIHAFLASREKPNLRLGEAAWKDYLPWDSPAFSELKEFIQMIAS